MINLMPPDLKTQIRYAKMNRVALRYAWTTGAVVLVLAAIFGGTAYLLLQQANALAADVQSKQQDIAAKKKTLLPKAQDASERLNAIKYIQDTQTKFSQVIADLVKVVPQGVHLDSMSLTGDEKTPLSIVVDSKSYDGVLALRNALVTSPRISAADIVSITTDNSGVWKGTLVVSFNKGQAK